jgi:hypothetical protein
MRGTFRPTIWDLTEQGESHPSGRVMCKLCRTRHLHWEDDGDGNWVLLTARGEVHRCPAAKPEDFEEIPHG